MSVEPAARFSLRDLPFPAKLVITCFLLAVGGGYSAAMVQLHMQDSKTGTPMPTMHDVILKYTGKKWFANPNDAPRALCMLEKVVTGSSHGKVHGTNMTPAFFGDDGGDYNKLTRNASPEVKQKIDAEREGERVAVALWAQAPSETREAAYKADRFEFPDGKAPPAVTPAFLADKGVKIQSILNERCVRCHAPQGQKPSPDLSSYSDLIALSSAPVGSAVPSGGGWVKVEEPIGLEKLTQTTHAHLLSFAMLFSLTGLAFAFTSYPAVVRCLVGPWVLIAVFVDVSLWWLARLCDQWGPYFAMGIIGTGGAAGVGLALQIVLSVFDMYAAKGKFVILVLFFLAGAGAGMVALNVIKPGLDAKQQRLAAAKTELEKKDPPVVPKDAMKGFERMLQFPVKGPDGKELAMAELKWKRDQEGGMVRAFFDKDKGDFAAALKAKDEAAQARMTPDRHGERAALLAWNKLPEADRRKAYELDAFVLPTEMVMKPITPAYVVGGKVKVKLLITDRCIQCHADNDEKDAPFSNYEELKKYLK